MPDELSGGEQQRVAIARAFVNRPMILIADEPTGNLDPTTSVGIMKLLDRINRTGTTVVMATHDAGVVDQMRKRVIELADGQRRARPGAGRLRLPALIRDRTPTSRPTGVVLHMQLRYVFTELGSGLRRNLSMHIAVILTLFVSLTLVGLGVLLNQEADQGRRPLGQPAPGHGLPVQPTATATRPAPARSPTPRSSAIQQVVDTNTQVVELLHRVQGGGVREAQGAVPRQVRRPELADHRGRHARVDLDHAQGPQPVPRRGERGRRTRRGLPGPGRPQGAETDLQHDLAG